MSLLQSYIEESKGRRSFANSGINYREWNINGHNVKAIFEVNQFYGSFLRQWQIDGSDRSTVKAYYRMKEFLLLDCSCGRLGERPFEEDSITYEFFIKPLGLPKEKLWNDKTNSYFFCAWQIEEILE